jgi:hypothetical protein
MPLRTLARSFAHTLTLITMSATFSVSALAQTSVTHVIQFFDTVGGKQTIKIKGNTLTVDFSYRNNGRGPDIAETIELDGKGQIVKLESTGKSTFGAPIDERFSRASGKAQWKSTADDGNAASDGSELYIPLEASSANLGIAINRLRAAKDNTLKAFPSGEVRMTKLADATATRTVNGKAITRPVELVALTGISLEPAYVWLWAEKATQDESDKPRAWPVLGIVEPGFSALEEGWDSNRDALLKIQQVEKSKRLTTLASKYTINPEGLVVFRNVRWYNSEAGRMEPAADIYVNHGRITRIAAANSVLEGKALVIDGQGKSLIPGLFDMHGHMGETDAMLQLASGVTTLRDMGNQNDFLANLKSRIDRNEALGPHVVATGFIEGKSPFSSTSDFVVASVEEAQKAVEWYSQRGFKQIKLYNSIKPEWVKPIAEYAKARGMRVGGHIPAFMKAEAAIRDGFDEIQHINQVMLNFLSKPDDDSRTLLRFYLVADNSREIDLKSQQVKDFIALMKARNTTIDTTVAIFETMFLQRQGELSPTYRMVAKNVPASLQRAWRMNSMDVNDKNAQRFKESYQRILEFIKLMHDSGVPLVAGTDDIAGYTLHRELEMYVLAGISANDALKIATWNGAKYSGVLDRTGSVTVGKVADLVLVDGDPSANISDIRKTSLVMKAGQLYRPEPILAELGITAIVKSVEVK